MCNFGIESFNSRFCIIKKGKYLRIVLLLEMTQDNELDLAQAYKQINEAEVQADSLEKMLDQLDAKMDSILKEAEGINKINETNETNENNEINSGASD